MRSNLNPSTPFAENLSIQKLVALAKAQDPTTQQFIQLLNKQLPSELGKHVGYRWLANILERDDRPLPFPSDYSKADWILAGFMWALTPEGHNFWWDVEDAVTALEQEGA